MALSLANWNVAENRTWYARLIAGATGIEVELYLTASDAAAQTDLQAFGESTGFGSSLDIVLTADSGATVAPTLFQPDQAWHLQAAGLSGDTTAKIFKIKPFVELPEIAHAIYRSSDLIYRRAKAAIDKATHCEIVRTIPLGRHIPSMDIGDVVALNSTRHGSNDLAQITGMQIEATPNSITNTITTAKYTAVQR